MSLLPGIMGFPSAQDVARQVGGVTPGFNPLSMLTGLPGLSSSSSATSSASGYLGVQYNAPFNVGRGDLSSTAAQTSQPPAVFPHSTFAGGGGAAAVDWMTIATLAAMGVAAWLIIK